MQVQPDARISIIRELLAPVREAGLRCGGCAVVFPCLDFVFRRFETIPRRVATYGMRASFSFLAMLATVEMCVTLQHRNIIPCFCF